MKYLGVFKVEQRKIIGKGLDSLIQKFKHLQEKKEEEIFLSPLTKTPTSTENSKKKRDNTNTPPKTSITQRLRTDLGRSVGVTTATQLVCQVLN